MAAPVEVRAPAEQTEGTRSQILRWLKSVGEAVSENEPLVELETDKVTVEVAAPATGTLSEILKQEQEEIAPGELLGRIEIAGASRISEARLAPSVSSVAPALSGTRASGAEPAGALGAAATARAGSSPGESSAGATSSVAVEHGAGRMASPAVRRLLAEHALQASEVTGTGQGARITVDDVLRHVAARGSIPVATPGGSQEVLGKSRQVPHSAVRRRIAEHMVHSLRIAPHVTTVFEANLSAILAHREGQREEFARRGAPLTLTAYFLQAAVAALRAVPEANSRWTDSALEIFDSIHIGVATALETGLVVPVLRDVQSRDLLATAQGLHDLVTRARESRLSPADVRGGTFTISNHGVSGSLIAAPIVINQPQAAILGVGKLEKRAVVEAGTGGSADRIAIQPRCYVTLTIDHRVMDGHQANRFLETFVRRLESWTA